MISVRKKISIAFYWHMHQPVYQLDSKGDYLMPWVRLHGVKDYLDMLLRLKKYPKIKLNFNLVPVLLDSFQDYSDNGAHDIHSRLTVSQIEQLNDEDKEFILNNFFDANYTTMIFPHPRYNELYQRRLENENIEISDFSNQDYSDIMAWFNLVWIDKTFIESFPEIASFLEKGTGFTLEDRIKIIDIHRKIISMIIPSYKEFLEKGQIELTTSPYYHPILPILADSLGAQKGLPDVEPQVENLDMAHYARLQIQMAISRFQEVFGVLPKGLWASEQALSPEVLEMFKELGIDWTISDEGILSNSINTEFVRDFKGYLEDPYFLTKSFKYKTKSSDIKILFRDSVLPNLISFEYPNHDPKIAAADLYDRIKVIQNKVQSSPDKNHVITIALDGENCWESYPDDGDVFLNSIYKLIEDDETLETVLISDYMEREKYHKELKKITSGSWINKNFQIWIAEPTKNLAWNYLHQAKNDYESFAALNPEHPNLILALRELMIAQGSDWFWWYGEPNDSGQDHIFDYLFREHIKNIYELLGLEVPDYLNIGLTSFFTRPTRTPKKNITPPIDGIDRTDDDEWLNAGCISMPDGPILRENKLYDKVCYGADENNLYLRIYVNSFVAEHSAHIPNFHQLYIYFRNHDKKQLLSPLRLINKTENVFPIIREKFHNEMRISVMDNKLYPVRLTRAIYGDLWMVENSKDIKAVYDKVIDILIPFDCLDIGHGDKIEFFFANTNFGVKDSFIPQDSLLEIERP